MVKMYSIHTHRSYKGLERDAKNYAAYYCQRFNGFAFLIWFSFQSSLGYSFYSMIVSQYI